MSNGCAISSDGFDDQTYPNGGLLRTLFDAKLYNGREKPSAERDTLFSLNKLVGGLLITQDRSDKTLCEPSPYSLYYDSCYRDNLKTAEPCGADHGHYANCPLVRQNSTRQSKECGAEDMMLGLDTSHLKLHEEYKIAYEASKFGRWREAPDQSMMDVDLVKSSFEYRYDNFGYSAWLSVADGYETNRKKVQQLKQNLWLDLSTRRIKFKFMFYNGNFGTFTFVAVSLNFNQYGTFKTTGSGRGDPIVTTGTFNMEPYITQDDFWRLSFELIYIFMVFYFLLGVLFDFVCAIGSSLTVRSLKPVCNWIDSIGILHILMDLTIFGCHLGFIFIRFRIIQKIICNPVYVPMIRYNEVLEDLDQMARIELQINFWSVVLGMFRFLTYYQFQPRLQIFNKTILNSLEHIFHFMVLLLLILVLFAIFGYLSFGMQNQAFSTLTHALMMMGQGVLSSHLSSMMGKAQLSNADQTVGSFFFNVWAFLILVIMLNIFVAILMDSYSEAKENSINHAGKSNLQLPTSVLQDALHLLGMLVSKVKNPIISWKYNHSTLLMALHRLDAKVVAPRYDEDTYRKELMELREQQEYNARRIEWLESMCLSDAHTREKNPPLQSLRHEEACSWEQIGNEIRMFRLDMNHEIPVEVLSRAYGSAVCFAEEGRQIISAKDCGDSARCYPLQRCVLGLCDGSFGACSYSSCLDLS